MLIQYPVEAQSATTGAISVTWMDLDEVWAAIEPLSAREFNVSQAEQSKISARITIRYRTDITSKMRLYYAAKDQYYNIHGVLSDKDSGLEYITLPCSEGLREQN